MPDRTQGSTVRRGLGVALLAFVIVVLVGVLLPTAAGATGTQEPLGTGTDEAPAGCAFNKAAAVEAYGQPLDDTIWGRLCQVIDDKPTFADGVTITVTQDGKEIGAVTTGEDGVFVVPIPENGTYQVELDPDSLPEDFELTNPDRATLESVRVNLGDQQVAFPLGAAESTGRTFEEYATTTANGIKLGLILAVAAVGLSLVFAVTGFVNFSHAEFVTLGALLALLFNAGAFQWPILIAAALGVIGTGLFAWSNELAIWRPLRKRRLNALSLMVVSIGLSIFLRSVFQVIDGPTRSQIGGGLQQVKKIGPVSLTPNDWIICGVCIVALGATILMLKLTRLGTSMRAVADNKDLAESSGIDVNSVIGKVWMLGGALAGLGGILYGLSYYVQFSIGFTLLLSLFAAVILGGLGSATGAVLGAIIIGIVQEVSGLFWDTDYKFASALIVLILVLLVRPQGLLGSKERIG